MMIMHRSILGLALVTALITTGCGKKLSPTDPRSGVTPLGQNQGDFDGQGSFGNRNFEDSRPVPDPEDFVSRIDNPYLPLIAGTAHEYLGIKDGLPEVNRVHVTHQKKNIIGVSCTVVLDSVFVGGVLHEATIDWYAQDEEGTVWYFGEDSREYDETGTTVISTEGSWLAGVDRARPGIVMEAHPRVGDRYRQEFAKGVAEDMARVLSLDAVVQIAFGNFSDCLKTKEWTPLDPGVVEHKFNARGIGLVKVVMVAGGTDHAELVKVWKE